jgi:hypothetical protein
MVQKPTGSGRLGGASSCAIQRMTGVPSCGAVLTEDQPPRMLITDMVDCLTRLINDTQQPLFAAPY